MQKLFIIFILWLSLLLGVGYYSKTLPLNPAGKCTVSKQLPFYRFDSFWYTSIARHGYNFSTERNSSIAFFPLYPLVIRGASFLIHMREATLSFFLNVFFVLLSVWAMFRLARLDWDEETSRNVVVLWLFFPPAYFLISGYPEALFILLAILSFLSARKRYWLPAAVFASLLVLTKPYGIFILPALLVEYTEGFAWQVRKAVSSLRWLFLTLPLFAWLGFVYFNYLKFGHPFAFFEAQQTWGRTLGNPLGALVVEAQTYLFSGHLLSGRNFPYLVYLVSFFFGLWATWLSIKYVRRSYLVFSLLLLLSALLTGTLTSFGRYMLLGFPVLMGPAIFLSQKKRWFLIYLLCSAATLLFLASLFVRCYPIE